ncbi:hypothetical protein N7574_07470 [Acinetobacter ursingii]|uniref:Phosphate-selective porin O and P n=2 Tax=Acinetobacter TaxID=469 RepID=N9DGS3_9GAMM|nr:MULTISPECIES: hypothetical protein [Acinetobacter]ENV79698.1 hypothetical protein F942_01745 [Acinetobacter ursingii ANC 3649]MDG9949161.1 hypothetical protein [Acinetobacter ursingii]MEC6126748.1 hypothetical protein [Acinetobacter ursingii]QXZ23173.1 hypothetical protein I6L31_16130 [Acinetobacter septicus]RSC24538.1 hypothetical protein EGS47_18205 [Acinetobacter sp. FDAARGOS_515]
MKRTLLFLGSIGLFSSMPMYASDLSIGDPSTDIGQLKLSGAIRTRYIHKDYVVEANEGSKNDDWQLADIKTVLIYENPDWIASLDLRCYQYHRLCDALFLKDAWAGYKISNQQRISVGFQSVDFGFGRLWGNSYYETLLNTVGLEDIQNLGMKYQFKDDQYNFILGFYPTDGGNYKGTSKDSSRYSGNFVEADDLTQGTDINEKNMWITRFSRKFELNATENFSTEIGGSYWYSELQNHRTDQHGNRRTWSIFSTTNYQAWQWLFLFGEQNIKNGDDLLPNTSTIGAFDYPYQVANKGQYMANEINYTFAKPFHQLENIKPYVSYSRFYKDESGYQDSDRLIAGLYFNYKKVGIQGEYILSRNDPMTGSGADGLAQGDSNQWNKLFYLSIGYYF